MIEPKQLKQIVEAALLAAGNPLSPTQLLALFAEQDEQPTHEDISRALGDLQIDCSERGVELVEVASGFRYQIRQDVHPWVARLWTERPSRYSRALLETLALIAYRQPITRAEIEQIRGVAVSTHIVKTLEEREWVRVVGHRDAPGRPALFGTTRGFLDYFNLKSLDELPSLSDIRDIDDLDPQLALGPPTEVATEITVESGEEATIAADPSALAAVAQSFEEVTAEFSGDDDSATPDPIAGDDFADDTNNPLSSADELEADTTEQQA